MRPIDADALVIDYYDDYETKDDEYTYAYVSKVQIDSAPTIDAVEVVQCKDCKRRYDDGWLEPRWTCDYLKDMRLKDVDFINHGKLKRLECIDETMGEREGE